MPATVVITEPFLGLVDRFAQTLGAGGYPAVALPHPVSTKSDEYLRQLAAACADDVVERLTRPW